MKVKRLARDAVLTAIALTIFVVELQLPDLVPIPGVKPGLSNIVTLVTLFTLGPWDALAVLLCRVLLGALFAGNPAALVYSLSGGLLAFCVTALMRRAVTEKQIWVASVFAAMGHNAGQLAAAVLVTKTSSLVMYLPVLLVSGIFTGFFTGLAGQYAAGRLGRILKR